MTDKEINDMKRQHNALQEQGAALYAQVLDIHKRMYAMRNALQDAEGDDYDDIPLMFGAGFWVDES